MSLLRKLRLKYAKRKPRNLDEAIEALNYILSSKDKLVFQEWGEKKFVNSMHHHLGRWIRNNWDLWDEKSKLAEWFVAMEIWHADDMSAIILTSYWRKIHGQPIRLEKQVHKYIKYWLEHDY